MRRQTLAGCLRTAAAAGFSPHTVVDLGAARGLWTLEASRIWPNAEYLLVEPLTENRPFLDAVCAQIEKASYILAVAADYCGPAEINVHPDLDGSSLFLEREELINGQPRAVEAVTVESLLADHATRSPILLKADVQGAELRVLKGTESILAGVDMVVLETLFYDVFLGKNPQFADVILYMADHGYAVWDIYGMEYRPLDDALFQADVAFVKADGMFRRRHQYATDDQRREQLRGIARDNPERLARKYTVS